jgi:hypothetical protein
MAAPPHCRSLSRRGTPAGFPLLQRSPPPVQTKPATTDPAELVTCDQTIEHTIRFAKQALGWTTPRPRHPEQADRWTWLVLPPTPSCAWPAGWLVTGGCHGTGPARPVGSPLVESGEGFRNFWHGWAPQPTRRDPADAPQADPAAATAARPPAIRPSRRQPDHHNQHQHRRQQGRPHTPGWVKSQAYSAN